MLTKSCIFHCKFTYEREISLKQQRKCDVTQAATLCATKINSNRSSSSSFPCDFGSKIMSLWNFHCKFRHLKKTKSVMITPFVWRWACLSLTLSYISIWNEFLNVNLQSKRKQYSSVHVEVYQLDTFFSCSRWNWALDLNVWSYNITCFRSSNCQCWAADIFRATSKRIKRKANEWERWTFVVVCGPPIAVINWTFK